MPKKKKKEVKLSATRISTFLQCKQRYYFNYIERVQKMDNPAFKLGLACHGALEMAGRVWQKESLTKFAEEHIQNILKEYDRLSVEEGIVEYAEHIEGRNIVENKLHNFSLGSKIIGIEDRFGFEGTIEIKTKSGIKLIGAMDKIIELDEDTLLVVDYKTSKTVPDATRLKHDVQLSMYHLVARMLYPKYKRIILSLDMLRKGEIVYTYRTDEEIDLFEKYLDVIYAEMVAFEEKHANPTLNMLCGWCDYFSICPSYQEFVNSKVPGFVEISSLADAELVQEWADIKVKKKLFEAREREVTNVIMDRMKVQEERIASDTEEMVIRQMARTNYSAFEISKIIPHDDFSSLVTVSPTKLKKYMDKNPSIKQLVGEIGETNYTSAFLASRKIKVDKPKKVAKKKTTKKKKE